MNTHTQKEDSEDTGKLSMKTNAGFGVMLPKANDRQQKLGEGQGPDLPHSP